jgi:carboxyl-terminal processing protease
MRLNGKGWRWIAASFGVLAAACALGFGLPSKDSSADAEIARRMVSVFSHEHLSRAEIDDDISAKAWTNFITMLDFERVFFSAEDIDKLGAERSLLDDQLLNGDVSSGRRVFGLFLERLSNRCDYVNTLLTKGFDVDAAESYVWKRKDAAWAKSGAELDELWRKRVKNEYVRILVDREMRKAEAEKKAKEAKEQPASTNKTDEVEGTADPDANLSPEDFIRKRYKQLLTVMSDTDSNWILQQYLSAVCMAYDPHSGYMSESSRENFDIEMKLSLCGIGAVLRPEDGAAKIERTIPGGPADRDKRDIRLRANDKIIAVGQDKEPMVDILHWPLDKAVKLIRGPKDSRVVLKVIPAADPSGSRVKIVDLVRDEVKLEEQAAKGKIRTVSAGQGKDRKLAVVTLPAFYANMQAHSGDADYRSSTDDVHKVLDEMKNNGAEGVVLDLRSNGGGSLVEAIRMTGLFVRAGPVVQVRERNAIRVLPDTDPSVVYGGPLVIMVNRLSASASEILAGALQDYGRAVILGDTRTHGKGTVQTVLDLSRDQEYGSVRITTASFYRISGSSTQLKGVSSDIVLHSPLDFMEVGEDALPCPMPWTQITPASYRPVGNLGKAIDAIEKKSEARRKQDARFIAYTKLLDRIAEMNRSCEIPLQIAERRKLAATEKELVDLQESMSDPQQSDGDKGEKSEKKDVVLDEGLAILSDLIDYAGSADDGKETTTAGSASVGIARSFADWIHEVVP